jgi:DNA-binding NarL/FixJ family response regulator
VLRRVVDGYVRDARRSRIDPDDHARLIDLTPRELEILHLIGEGMSNNDIAKALFLSLHTVKTHVSRILQKTGSPQRGQAAALAHRCATFITQELAHP